MRNRCLQFLNGGFVNEVTWGAAASRTRSSARGNPAGWKWLRADFKGGPRRETIDLFYFWFVNNVAWGTATSRALHIVDYNPAGRSWLRTDLKFSPGGHTFDLFDCIHVDEVTCRPAASCAWPPTNEDPADRLGLIRADFLSRTRRRIFWCRSGRCSFRLSFCTVGVVDGDDKYEKWRNKTPEYAFFHSPYRVKPISIFLPINGSVK